MMMRISVVIAAFVLFGLYVMDYNASMAQCELKHTRDVCASALR